MFEKFYLYLDTLPLTLVVKKRIDELIILNSKLINEEILDIFICDMKNHDGTRTYLSLWLFAEKYVFECKNFLNTYDFDITPYFKKIDYCYIKPINFDFETTNEKSSVNIFGALGENTIELIATEQNCLKALDVYKKYIIRNLVD